MTARDPTRRRRILDAARRHLTARGFRGLTLDAVAAEVGCAKGALYLEFADKEALLRAVVDETLAAVRDRYLAEVLALPSPLARLGQSLRFAFREFTREPLFARLMAEDPELRALTPTPDEAVAARAQIDLLAGWVDEGIARGEIRPDVDRDAVPFAIGVLRSAPQLLARSHALGVLPGDGVLEGLVDLFVAGLAARPASPPARKIAPARKTTPKRRTR